jgi:hypothetical protein
MRVTNFLRALALVLSCAAPPTRAAAQEPEAAAQDAGAAQAVCVDTPPPGVAALLARPPDVGVGGTIALFVETPPEPPRDAIPDVDALDRMRAGREEARRLLERSLEPVHRCQTALARRRPAQARGAVRVRLVGGVATILPGASPALAACVRRSPLVTPPRGEVRPDAASASGVIALAFELGRRRRTLLGPLSAPGLDPAVAAGMDRALRARLPALEARMAATPGRGEVEVRVLFRARRVVGVAAAGAPSSLAEAILAAVRAATEGVCVPGAPAADTWVTLPVALFERRARGGDLAGPEGIVLDAQDCEGPVDCPRRARCVASAMGGGTGCTGQTCCGSAECSNGCLRDADCPSCRPRCTGRGGEAGICTRR